MKEKASHCPVSYKLDSTKPILTGFALIVKVFTMLISKEFMNYDKLMVIF